MWSCTGCIIKSAVPNIWLLYSNRIIGYLRKYFLVAASAKPKPPVEREMSGEEIDDKASEIFSKEILTGLADPVWKTRLSAVENFMQVIPVQWNFDPLVPYSQFLANIVSILLSLQKSHI